MWKFLRGHNANLAECVGGGKPVNLSDRKLRMFAVACCRQVWHLLGDEKSRNAVELAERHADEGASLPADINRADYLFGIPGSPERHAAVMAVDCLGEFGPDRVWYRSAGDPVPQSTQAHLLRDIIGNPFRPVAWRWPAKLLHNSGHHWTAIYLAQAAYDDRDAATGHLDPVRLAVLADALEEAGCPQTEKVLTLMGDDCLACGGKCVHSGLGRAEAIECVPCRRVWLNGEHYLWPQPHPLLAHLRSTGPHVRGCWALDLVLGKE
jgi:hypothetical protein